MKRHVICAAAALSLAFAGVSAAQSQSTGTGQSQSTATGQSQSTTQPQSAASPNPTGQQQPITVTGCLIGSGAPGTAGSASAAVTPGGYMLMNASNGSGDAATPASASATGTPGATGTSGTTPNSAYSLAGGNQEELQRFANSRVVIIGTITPATGAAGTPGAAGTAGTAGAAGAAGTASSRPGPAPQLLTITTVRQVSATCGGK